MRKTFYTLMYSESLYKPNFYNIRQMFVAIKLHRTDKVKKNGRKYEWSSSQILNTYNVITLNVYKAAT